MSPWRWNQTGLCDDQGPDCNCAASWAEYHKRINVDRVTDTSHGANNDNKAIPRECGLWGHVLLQTLGYNIWERPYQGAAYLSEARSAIREYCVMVAVFVHTTHE